MTNILDIHYHQDREEQTVYYAFFTSNFETYIFIHRPEDSDWVWIDKGKDERGWWFCHSNIFRVSHSFKVTIEEIGKAGLPILDSKKAMKMAIK